MSPQGQLDLRKSIEVLARLPLSSQPGTEFEYNVGYPVIGVIIETIVGETLEQYYQKRIFGPLGMKDTSFYLPRKKQNRFAALYQLECEGGEYRLVVLERADNGERLKGPGKCLGAGGEMGGVLSSVGDYTRFAQMLLSGGELDSVRILGRKTAEYMTSSHTGDIPIPMLGRGAGYGMGVVVHTGEPMTPGVRSVGTYGSGGAAGTTFSADPKEGLLTICFTQVLSHSMKPDKTLQNEFERLAYQALL